MKLGLLSALILLSSGCAMATAKLQPVTIERTDEGYVLMRGGAPYEVRGVGIGMDDPNAKLRYEQLKASGGNSFRTWNIGDRALLDRAHELGLTVALCLDVRRERHGFDYGDPEAVRAQFEALKQQVMAFRDHPALLVWVIGNELNHDYSDPRVYDAVNDISRMIHEVDPHHPTTTTTAGISPSLARVIAERAPDLDFISVQVYGALATLPEQIREIELDKPLMVTEWGTIGHWEVPTTEWGAPLELDSAAKAENYRQGAAVSLAELSPWLIGNYAFLWGQKQERTPTWYGVFVDEAPTQAVDVLQEFWTGAPPNRPAPVLQDLRLDGRTAEQSVRLRAGQVVRAEVTADSAWGSTLSVRWELLEESTATQSGGDPEERPAARPEALGERSTNAVAIEVPAEVGAYRLFVYVTDEAGAVAHANVPFLVEEGMLSGN